MKKIVSLILILILILTLFCGCSNKSAQSFSKQITQKEQDSAEQAAQKEQEFESKAHRISKGMTYDKVIEIMDMEIDEKINYREDFQSSKEKTINEFTKLTYDFLYGENSSVNTDKETKENIEYFLPAYDHIDDVVSDYYDRRITNEVDSLKKYQSVISKEEHDENWLKAVEFLIWKFPSWHMVDENYSPTFESYLQNKISYIHGLTEYKDNFDIDGYECTWLNHYRRGSGTTHITVYFNSEDKVIDVNIPRLIIN